MKFLSKRAAAMAAAGAIWTGMSIAGIPWEASAAPQDVFYVSVTGSDTTGTGAVGSPWATIGHARDVIESTGLNDAMTGDIDVYVGAGDYYVDQTIAFDESDSGSNGFSINYRNKDAVGSARLHGGKPVTGWTQHSGDIYKAYVGTTSRFDTLYENGERAIKARYPNYAPDPARPMAKATYLTSENSGVYDVVQYKAGELDPTGWDLTDAQVFGWSLGPAAWFTDTTPVSSIDPATRQISLSQDARYVWRAGSRFVVQGVLQLLDQAGEFHLDTTSGYLYYWAKDGAPSAQDIIVPTVKTIVSLKGSSEAAGQRVHDVTFDGLRFEYTDFTDWYRHAWPTNNASGLNHTYNQYDRQMNMPQHQVGTLLLQNTDHITIKNSHFANSGYTAIFMLFYNQNNTISGNLIEHAGHSGIYLEGRYPGEGDVNKNNVLTNNVIHDVGELVGSGGGVYLMNSGGNEVSYSEIYNSPRYAVVFDTYVGIPLSAIYLRGNVMKYLKIHDMSQDSGDTAPIYSWGRSSAANTVDQVTVDRVYAHPSMKDYAPNGVFMDNESSGQTFRNIKVTNTQGVAYRVNQSSGHTLTNVSWQAGFNDALMDYGNIGVTPAFPYAVAPNDLSAGFTGGHVALAWKPVLNASSYDVLRSTTQGGPYTTTVCSATSAATCSDSTGTPGTTYFYVVRSRTAAGSVSGYSKEVSALYKELLFDGFESSLVDWTAVKGTASTSTAQAHSGGKSFAVDQDTDVIAHSFGSSQNRVISTWFYDDASDASVQAMAKADDTVWSDGTKWRGLGVNTPTSTTKYVTRVNGTLSPTAVTRTTGWHELKWDYRSGTKVDMYIDGTLVASPTGVTAFNQISMGDWWVGNSANVYFDDVLVNDPFDDGFESGLGAWTTGYGTASAGTAQAHSGTTSYIIDQDQDVITRVLGSDLNRTATLWFYDNAADTTMQVMARVDNTVWSDGTKWRGLGVNTPTSTTKYVTRVNGTLSPTTVTRTTGWHELKWDYSSGTKVDMYIDGTLVASPTGVTTFDHIAMGDWWAGTGGAVYFDDVSVR